ncbi:MAG: glycosyltransferase [Lachnospiraceae bacterium]|nr:glycosyltransferase [Lachnospiraceae bacterium]MDD7027460.1 glycosyltransferase [Lachnospiraceae bacterium]MDY5701521.1 glycosyltransferase [Lachnospiraceae bacterium]
MEKMTKENKFISLVIYLHNNEEEIIPFLEKVLPIVEQGFSQYEIVCVNDACTDKTIFRLKEYLEEAQTPVMVNIVHMSFYHGLESAMNAGRDLAIGDFVYEFDSIFVDYPPELLLKIYEKLLEGNDIVAAGRKGRIKTASRIFYALYNKTSRGKEKIGPQTFRIVSRRAINRVKSLGQYIPYRKAVYANCGLSTQVIIYKVTKKQSRKSRQKAGERVSLALDSFIYFTNAMERLSACISGVFLLITIGMGVYILWDYFTRKAVAEGWMSTVGFLALGFFGVFSLLTIILKYLSVLLNLVFRQQRYLVLDIEKVVKE